MVCAPEYSQVGTECVKCDGGSNVGLASGLLLLACDARPLGLE